MRAPSRPPVGCCAAPLDPSFGPSPREDVRCVGGDGVRAGQRASGSASGARACRAAASRRTPPSDRSRCLVRRRRPRHSTLRPIRRDGLTRRPGCVWGRAGGDRMVLREDRRQRRIWSSRRVRRPRLATTPRSARTSSLEARAQLPRAAPRDLSDQPRISNRRCSAGIGAVAPYGSSVISPIPCRLCQEIRSSRVSW